MDSPGQAKFSDPATSVPRWAPLLEAACLFVILFLLLQHLFDRSVFVVFQARDLDRAQRLASGEAIFFGPETTGGGHLPGSFYYLLLALPLKLGLGWVGAWRLEMSMAAAGGAVLWWFMRSHFGIAAAWITLASVMTSDFMHANLLIFENSSYIPLFVVASLISLCCAFAQAPERKKGRAWILACLSCGLGVQVHFTIAFVLLAGIALQLGAARFGVRPISRKSFASGILIFAVTLLPYGCWLSLEKLSIPIGQAASSFTGESALGWIALLHLVKRLPRLYLAREYLRNALLSLVPLGAFLALGLLAIVERVDGGMARKDVETPRADFIESCSAVLLVVSIVAFVPCLFIVQRSFNRYGVVFILAASLLVGVRVGRYERSMGRSFGVPAAAGIIAFLAWDLIWFGPPGAQVLKAPAILFVGITGLLFASLVRRASPEKPPLALLLAIGVLPGLISLRCYDERVAFGRFVEGREKNLATTFGEFEAMSREIYLSTGWSYAEAKRRIFYVNIRKHASPAYIYNGLASAEGAGLRGNRSGSKRIDGFFVGRFVNDDPWRGFSSGKSWLLGQDIEATLKTGIRQGAIALGPASSQGSLLIVPYEIKDRDRFPPYFHNLGEGYAQESPMENKAPVAGSRSFRFVFNDSPSKRPIYDIRADVQLISAGRGRWEVGVGLSGEPISQASFWISPDWTQEIARPYFSYSCEGRERDIQLADSIGFTFGKNENFIEGSSFLAPYERRFRISCPKPIERLAVGYRSSVAYEGGRAGRPLIGQQRSQRLQQPLGHDFGAVGSRGRVVARRLAGDLLQPRH